MFSESFIYFDAIQKKLIEEASTYWYQTAVIIKKKIVGYLNKKTLKKLIEKK